MRPSNVCLNRLVSVTSEKQHPLRIQNREMLRDIVTDYVLRSLAGNTQTLSRKCKQPKYQSLSVKIQVNGKHQKYEFPLHTVLQKYVELVKASAGRGDPIETVIVGMLELMDKLEDKAETLSIEVEGTPSADSVLKTLVGKHLRDKRRQDLQGEFEEAKTKVCTKYKKVSFLALEESGISRRHFQMLVDRPSDESRYNNQTMEEIKEDKNEVFQKYLSKPSISKLKQLVDSCNIFEHSQKVQELRKEKLVSKFCKDEEEYNQLRDAQKTGVEVCANGSLDVDTGRLLEEWVAEISLSEQLFRRKYFPVKAKEVRQSGQSDETEPRNA